MPNQGNRKGKNKGFMEKLGPDVDLHEHKVDDLRKMASELNISGSHDMKKDALVAAINKARQAHGRK